MNLEDARATIANVDEKMAALFEARMQAARDIAAYKKEHGLPIEDKAQEARVIEQRSTYIEDEELLPYYRQFIQNTMDVCKSWQRHLNG